MKGYAAHERGTLEAVTAARAQLQQAGTPGQAAEANNMLTQTLRSLFAVAEAYPNLKADQNFRELQAELTDTEDKIAYARQFYNTNVLSYNAKTQTFPSVIFANTFGFQPAEFFEAENDGKVVLYYFGNVKDSKGTVLDKVMVTITAKNAGLNQATQDIRNTLEKLRKEAPNRRSELELLEEIERTLREMKKDLQGQSKKP